MSLIAGIGLLAGGFGSLVTFGWWRNRHQKATDGMAAHLATTPGMRDLDLPRRRDWMVELVAAAHLTPDSDIFAEDLGEHIAADAELHLRRATR